MTDDRRRKPQGASGWTPRNLGMAALAMAGGMGGIRGRAPSRQRPDRGGLDWTLVRALLLAAAARHPELRWLLYGPAR